MMRSKSCLTPKSSKMPLIKKLVIQSEIFKRQLEEDYLNIFAKLDPQDKYFDAKKTSLKFNKKRF